MSSEENLPESFGSFRLISMTGILHPPRKEKEKKKSFTARSTMYQHGVFLVYGVGLSAREKAETYAFPRLHPHGSYVKAERGAAHY